MLRQSTFWQGRGGAVEHAISGIDIALWDIMGKVCGQPVCRLLGGTIASRIKPYGSILFDEPTRCARRSRNGVARASRRSSSAGVRLAGASRTSTKCWCGRPARPSATDVELMVDAGGSEQFWPHGYEWARETREMLANYDITWFEEPLPPDDLEGYVELHARLAGADRGGRSADAPAIVPALYRDDGPWTLFSPIARKTAA